MEFFVLLLIGITFASANLENEYTNSAYLDEAEFYRLHWRIDNAKKRISFAVQVKTLGWVGFGISAGTGNMVGSDVVIGYVKDGKGYLKDRYAEKTALPPIDPKQDYNLEAAYEKDGKTVLKFNRAYDTCDDERDNKIEEGTVRLVYAYHADDPTSEDAIPTHQKRGSRSLILRNIMTKKPSLPKDLQHFDLRVNTSVSDADTTYYCKPFKMPDLGSKKHIVKIEPIVTPGHEGLVHHILIYGCNDDFPVSNLSAESICYEPNMPGSFAQCVGNSVVAAWAIGGTSFYFPDHVGYPLGDGIGPKYVLMEVHYNNPDKKSGLKDFSGLRFHYTSTLRQYDAGIVWVGWGVVPTLVVPPRQKKWLSVGYCSANCTRLGLENSTLPEKGIKVFAYLPHAHLLGSALWTKHVRNGVELPEVARDDHYDFNYQEYHVKQKETHILPGDDLIQYCQYDSSKRKNETYGGLKTQEEMCLNFLYYYPRTDLTKCVSRNYGINYLFYGKHFWKNKTLVGYPPEVWTDDLISDLKKSYEDYKYVRVTCRKQKSEKLRPIHGQHVLKAVITKPLEKENTTCEAEVPKTTPGAPEGAGSHVTGCHVLIFIAVLKACMILY